MTVTLVLNGTGGHDAGNAASGCHEAGDEALAGEAELTENTVHDEGNSCHVADILKDGKQQEEYQHLRYETEHGTNAGHDAVLDEAVENGALSDMKRGENAVYKSRNPLAEDHIIGEVGGGGTDGHAPAAHGDGVDEEHDDRKDGKTENPVGHDLVDLVGYGELTAGAALLYCSIRDGGNAAVPQVGDDALGVIVQLLFAGADDFFRFFQGFFGEGELGDGFLVSLENLDGIPAKKTVIPGSADHRFDGFHGIPCLSGQEGGTISLILLSRSGDGAVCQFF